MELPSIIYARIDSDEDGEFCVSSDTKYDMLNFQYGVYELVGTGKEVKFDTDGMI